MPLSISYAIFWPAIVMALATCVLFVPMVMARIAAVKAGEAKGGHFRLRTKEPDRSKAWVNAVTNQFETPVLFYAVCTIAFVTGTADTFMLVLAWTYTVSKLVQIAILVTANTLQPRMAAFGIALLALALMWFWLAVKLVTSS